MQKNEGTLTVYFDDPFWVGVYERVSEGNLQACKITFGAEPKDGEVHAFLLEHWSELRFSPAVAAGSVKTGRVNPKRRQRAAHKQVSAQGTGTKSQQALAMQREQNKVLRKQQSRQQKREEEQRQFALRQQKRKQKHRGR